MAGCIIMVLGVIGKVGAFLAGIPDPVLGGLYMVVFGKFNKLEKG